MWKILDASEFDSGKTLQQNRELDFSNVRNEFCSQFGASTARDNGTWDSSLLNISLAYLPVRITNW